MAVRGTGRPKEARRIVVAVTFRARRGMPVIACACLLLGGGCTAGEMSASSESIYLVNSFRVPCIGVGPMSCLQVRREGTDDEQWQNFYAQISGFDYEPGYLYRLRVRETRLPPEQVPADASSIRYELLEVMDKSPDPRFALHDIWALKSIAGEAIDHADAEHRPYIEFNVTRGEYMGTASCGSFRGEMLTVSPGELQLGPASPGDADPGCSDDSLLHELSAVLLSVAYWRRDGLTLALTGADGEDLLTFHKID